jgi:DnaJ like chaperone protein
LNKGSASILAEAWDKSTAMSIWSNIGDVLSRMTTGAVFSLVEAVRSMLEGDPATRRRVAFSVAMIALSAKMAKADGIVTFDEMQAFQQIFHIPEGEERNVARLFDLALRIGAGQLSGAGGYS